MPSSIDSIETGITWMLTSGSLLLGSLTEIEYGDIAIRPFRLEVDGVVFGLVVGSREEDEGATLWPDDLFFAEPWDGRYDT
jgi:hypothetical protein